MVEDVLSVMDKYVQRKDPFTDRNSLGKLKFRQNYEKNREALIRAAPVIINIDVFFRRSFFNYFNAFSGNTTDYSDTESRSSSYLTESWKETRSKCFWIKGVTVGFKKSNTLKFIQSRYSHF